MVVLLRSSPGCLIIAPGSCFRDGRPQVNALDALNRTPLFLAASVAGENGEKVQQMLVRQSSSNGPAPKNRGAAGVAAPPERLSSALSDRAAAAAPLLGLFDRLAAGPLLIDLPFSVRRKPPVGCCATRSVLCPSSWGAHLHLPLCCLCCATMMCFAPWSVVRPVEPLHAHMLLPTLITVFVSCDHSTQHASNMLQCVRREPDVSLGGAR